MVYERQGLYITRDLSLQEWRDLGVELTSRINGSTWQLGDWLVNGGRKADRLMGNGEWFTGSVYDEAARLTGFDKAHLSNCYSVSTAYPRGERFQLSWSHHRVALKIKDSEQRRTILQSAQEQHWTYYDLDAYLLTILPKPTPPDAPLPTTRAPHLWRPMRVRCPECAHEFEVRKHRIGNERSQIAKKPSGRPRVQAPETSHESFAAAFAARDDHP